MLTEISITLGMAGLRDRQTSWIEENGVENTRATYATYRRQYQEYCAAQHYEQSAPEAVSAFLRHGMEDRDLSASTLNNVAACAVADMFKYDRVKPTNDPLVRETKRIIARKAKKGSGPKTPLPRAILEDFIQMAQPKRVNDARDVLMFILMFGGFLRECEAAALKSSDVWVKNGNLYVFVEKSKTDQTRIGDTVVLAGCSTSPLCPVSWFRLYKRKRPKGKWLFHNSNKPGAKLSAKRPNGILKEWLKRWGMSDDDAGRYGSHSLRRGGATSAAAEHVQIHVMKRHGRWKSDAVYMYIVESELDRLGVSRAVLGFDL